MRFHDPIFLGLGLFVFVAAFLWLRSSSKLRLRFSSVDLFKTNTGKSIRWRSHAPFLLRTLALIFIVFALMRPQIPKGMAEIKTDGVDILLVLDTSGSMRALDFSWNGKRVMRLDVVKRVVRDFVEKRRYDRIGLVVFGEEAFTQCPLTLDHGMVADLMQDVRIGMAGDATAIGSAIAIGTKRLKDLKGKSKIMVLLTDGRSNAGSMSPENASQLAKTFGIKIYTIGVGTEGKAPFLVDGLFGQQTVYQQVDLDESTLKKIAETTGGKYFRATDTESLVNVYDAINQLEKTEIKARDLVDYEERFSKYVLLALACLVCELALSETRLRKLPV